jgi:predicted kinase
MPKCTFLVGVPGSGKSTWLKGQELWTLIVSTDNIIEELAETYGLTYDQVFKDTIRFAELVMNNEMDKTIAYGDANFHIDRTNLTVKSRRKFIEKLKPHGYEFEAVVFPMPGTEKLSQEEWNRRLDSRPGKTIPGYILSSMIEHYEPPTEAEGFDKIIFL